MTTKKIQSVRDALEDGIEAPDLAKRQAEVLCYLLQCWISGFIPTFREIGEEFGISVNGVTGHVRALQAKGYLSEADANKSPLMLADKALELVL